MSALTFTVLAGLAILSPLVNVVAQDKPQENATKPTPSPSPKLGTELDGPVIVNTDLITLTVTVTDTYGRYVSGLSKNAFNVFDEKQPQEITYFSDDDAPVSVGVIFDEDRNSFYKQDQLFARLREEDVQIYVIGFVNELEKDGGFIRKSSREKAVNLLNRLATETGGRAFYPQSLSELPQIANEIIRDLRTQYVLAYNPTNKARDGSYRAIKVTVNETDSSDKRIALTRSGRLAPKGEPPLKPLPQRTPAKTPQPASKTRTDDLPY